MSLENAEQGSASANDVHGCFDCTKRRPRQNRGRSCYLRVVILGRRRVFKLYTSAARPSSVAERPAQRDLDRRRDDIL
jgi:hypothetical protein